MSTPDSSTCATKACTKCGRVHPATAEWFHRKNTVGEGCLAPRCKDCENEASRLRYAANREAYLAVRAKWRAENAELHARLSKAWKAAHPERAQVWRQRYRETHLEQERARCRMWAQEHPEHMQAKAMRWVAENPEKAAALWRNRRSRKQAAEGSHTAADIQAQYDRQKGRCFYCSVKVGKSYHVDHVIPLAKGGSNGPENLVVACPTCNMSKGAKHPMDFCGRLV